MSVSHKILDAHDRIAWDMDGTLFKGPSAEAPNAQFFLEYIRSTPHKHHHVITFRDRIWANKAWTELRLSGLDINLIKSVQSCPEPVHECFMIQKSFGHHPDHRKIYKSVTPLTDDEFDYNAYLFKKWKGERAFALGCTILVDDMPNWVIEGCQQYGIEFLHAHLPC